MSQRDLAKSLDMKFNVLHGLIYRAQKEEAEASNLSNKSTMETETKGNLAVVTSRGKTVRTLDELLLASNTDLETWRVDRHNVNKWDVAMKLDDGEIFVQELWQVKAWLTNLYPEAIQPVISPVEISIDLKGAPPQRGAEDQGKVVILADPHFGFTKDVNTGELMPFHDREALAVAVQMVQHLQPRVILLMGDWIDLAEWSDKFVRSPDMYNTTQPALIEGAWFIAQLRAASPNSKIHFLEGNHEKRVVTAINKQVPFAYGITQPGSGIPLLSIQNMLGLDKLGVEYTGNYPNGEVWLSSNLRAIHGNVVRAKQGATAAAILDDSTVTTLFGHVHRQELVSKTLFNSRGPRVISAFTPGCLCRIDGVVPAVKANMNWQQGIGIVTYDTLIHRQAIIPVSIVDGIALYGDHTFEGHDYLPSLIEDTGYKF
jgi:hypothetical protein